MMNDDQNENDWLFSETSSEAPNRLGIGGRVAGAGAYLAQARKKNKIEIEKIAAVLRLSVQQVERLERDEIEAFPGEAFVRGYYRLYAKIIGVNESEIAALLDRKAEALRGPNRMHRIINHGYSIKPATSWKLPAALACIGLVALGVTLWSSHTGSGYGIDNLKALFNKAPLSETVALDPAELLKNNLTGVPDIATSQNTAIINDEQAAKERLYLTIKEASWVSIKDASKSRLLYQWVEKGQEIELFGFPPFKVFVGNARGVEVEYRGKPFPLQTEGSNLYSRFTIGTEHDSGS